MKNVYIILKSGGEAVGGQLIMSQLKHDKEVLPRAFNNYHLALDYCKTIEMGILEKEKILLERETGAHYEITCILTNYPHTHELHQKYIVSLIANGHYPEYKYEYTIKQLEYDI